MYLSSKIGVNELRKNAKQAVNQASINQTDVSNVMIPLPLIEEQNKIVEAIESRLSVADKMEESINQSLQQAEALKQSILKKAFEGKLI
jgi:type I restriction enzyme S subunit